MVSAVLLATHEVCVEHDTGRWHPERPARMQAVLDGVAASGAAEAVHPFVPRPARREELLTVHRPALLDAIEAFCAAGGGSIDADTVTSARSWEAALVAAGAGLDAAARLTAGEGDAAFIAVRPPGHHATPGRAMGFCLLNNVAVTAANLAAGGQRVLIVDIDAHHGNGTQEAFYRDPAVTYVSLHEWPLYPGTGWLDETGAGEGEGANFNLPVPAGATGDVFLAAVERVVAPLASRLRPDWLLVSAGYDGHAADPLTNLGLSSGDYGLLLGELRDLVPAGRLLVFLEGGYDLAALTHSTAATIAALAGERLAPERPTRGGPGGDVVDVVERLAAHAT